MEGKSIILDLFNEGISFAERLSPQNSEYHSIVSKEEQKMNALKDKLNTDQLKALEEFLAIKNRYDAIYRGDFQAGCCIWRQIYSGSIFIRRIGGIYETKNYIYRSQRLFIS